MARLQTLRWKAAYCPLRPPRFSVHARSKDGRRKLRCSGCGGPSMIDGHAAGPHLP